MRSDESPSTHNSPGKQSRFYLIGLGDLICIPIPASYRAQAGVINIKFGNCMKYFIYLHTETMPLITPTATPSSLVQVNETVQPQALSHGESADTPVSSSSSVTRNEANVEAGANQHSSSSLHSRSNEPTEREMSPMEDMMLHFRSWCNYCRYCDVQKCVQNYCGRMWTEFSSFIGLQVGSTTATAITESSL